MKQDTKGPKELHGLPGPPMTPGGPHGDQSSRGYPNHKTLRHVPADHNHCQHASQPPERETSCEHHYRGGPGQGPYPPSPPCPPGPLGSRSKSRTPTSCLQGLVEEGSPDPPLGPATCPTEPRTAPPQPTGDRPAHLQPRTSTNAAARPLPAPPGHSAAEKEDTDTCPTGVGSSKRPGTCCGGAPTRPCQTALPDHHPTPATVLKQPGPHTSVCSELVQSRQGCETLRQWEARKFGLCPLCLHLDHQDPGPS